MTKEEKKERKLLRRKLMKLSVAHLSPQLRLVSTTAQLRKFGRVMADQILAGKNPHEVQVFA